MKKSTALMTIVVCLSALLGAANGVAAEDLVAIVHRDNSVSIMELKTLRKIYNGTTKIWSNGELINLWLPPRNSKEMEVFASRVLRKGSERAVHQYYLAAIFQQKFTATPPLVANTRDAMAKVSATKGGIAIVKRSEIGSAPGVKLLTVSGL